MVDKKYIYAYFIGFYKALRHIEFISGYLFLDNAKDDTTKSIKHAQSQK